MPSTEKINQIANVRRRLHKRPRDINLQAICDATGLGLDWLKNFHAGKYANPHTPLLNRLETYLDSLKADA